MAGNYNGSGGPLAKLFAHNTNKAGYNQQNGVSSKNNGLGNGYYGKYETLAQYGSYGARQPQGDWQTAAALTREQYDDWRARYLPRLARLMDLSEDNRLMNAQLARTGNIATSSLRSAQLAKENQMARYGVNRPDNPQNNTPGLRNALAIAGAKNGIREAELDRQMNILTGGSAPVRQQMNIGGQMQTA